MYDLTLGIEKVNGRIPNLFDIKNGEPVKAKFFIRRIPITSIPIEDEQKCNEFLIKLYEEKVKLNIILNFKCFLNNFI